VSAGENDDAQGTQTGDYGQDFVGGIVAYIRQVQHRHREQYANHANPRIGIIGHAYRIPPLWICYFGIVAQKSKANSARHQEESQQSQDSFLEYHQLFLFCTYHLFFDCD
jgi:hypothetical protein